MNSGTKGNSGTKKESVEVDFEGRRGFIASDREESRGGFDGGQMKKEIRWFVEKSGGMVGNIAKLRRDNYNFLS